MHAPAGRAIHWIMVVAILVTVGCRGSNPFGRYVQVTKTANADAPEIEAPPQRLLTAKPRTGDDSVSPHQVARGESTQVDAAGLVTQHDPNTTDLASTPASSSQAQPDQAVSSRNSIPATAVSTRLSSKSSLTSESEVGMTGGSLTAGQNSLEADARAAVASQPQSVASSIQDLTDSQPSGKQLGADLNSEAILAALKDFPPELRQQALRQFIAAAARSAGQTSQPNTLADELAKKINDLPTLPEPRSSVPAISPQRIALDGDDGQSAIAALSNSRAIADPSESSGASASLTDLEPGELENVDVQAISESIRTATPAVTPASGTLAENEIPVVSQAIVDSTALKQANETTSKIEPVTEAVPRSDAELITELVERLSRAAPDESEAERSSRLIKLRHLMVLNGDPDSAVEQIEGMAEAEQEYLRHHLLGLWTMIDPQGHPVPSRRFTTAIPQIREAAKFAAAATDSLEVRSLAFCTEIESYGQITPFPGNRFKPGQQVILYCEIENFTVKKLDEGYETHLLGSYDVFDSKNEKIFSQVLPADKQTSANYLRDYFIAYQMYLPTEIPAGTYRLQLTMEDSHGKKYGQSSIPFEIAK